MATLIDEFVGFTETLNRKGVDYAVCGGWAMAIHGLPRATIDIDLLILADDLAEVWATAKEQDYNVEGLPLHFAGGRISKVDKLTKKLFTLDFLLVTEALQEVWDHKELIAWDEGETWVVSKEGLITMKSISGREQDLLDIKKLSEVADEG